MQKYVLFLLVVLGFVLNSSAEVEAECHSEGETCSDERDCCSGYFCDSSICAISNATSETTEELVSRKMRQLYQSGECRWPGMICSRTSECCSNFACNPWAGRCTKSFGIKRSVVDDSKTSTKPDSASSESSSSSSESSSEEKLCVPLDKVCVEPKDCCKSLICDLSSRTCKESSTAEPLKLM